ncbi:WD40-repeat-containing domain protein [Gaertneriomyces semiglobifer]|nr:WD40-repeat-containing domain protein [Gaertneriomyces semiglobifer]
MTAPVAWAPFRAVNRISKTEAGYVLDIIRSPDRTIVVAPTSSGWVQILDPNLTLLFSFRATSGLVNDILTEAVFDPKDSSLLWVGSKLGKVRLFDVRTGQIRQELDAGAPVLSISVNSDNTLLAAGTELDDSKDEGDAKLCIWDLRNPSESCIAAFVECHSDDITQVRFHPTEPLAMISGSTDGLICLYNLSSLDEDDALYQVIKQESIARVGYFGPNYEYIYSLNHTETFSLWRFVDGEKMHDFGDVRVSCEAQGVKLDYLIDSQYASYSGRLFLVGGDQDGNLGIFHVTIGKLELVHTLNGGHSDIVRGVDWDVPCGTLISGAEDGQITLWRNT